MHQSKRAHLYQLVASAFAPCCTGARKQPAGQEDKVVESRNIDSTKPCLVSDGIATTTVGSATPRLMCPHPSLHDHGLQKPYAEGDDSSAGCCDEDEGNKQPESLWSDSPCSTASHLTDRTPDSLHAMMESKTSIEQIEDATTPDEQAQHNQEASYVSNCSEAVASGQLCPKRLQAASEELINDLIRRCLKKVLRAEYGGANRVNKGFTVYIHRAWADLAPTWEEYPFLVRTLALKDANDANARVEVRGICMRFAERIVHLAEANWRLQFPPMESLVIGNEDAQNKCTEADEGERHGLAQTDKRGLPVSEENTHDQ